MNVYLLVATAGAGLMMLDRYLEKERDKRLAKIVCKDVIPAVGSMLDQYTGDLMGSVKKMTEDMVEKYKDMI